MNHKAISFYLIGILLLSVGCSNYFLNAQSKTLTILHTNDMHAAFLPHEASWVQTDPKPMVGGFQELWWMIDSLWSANKNSILLDAGDVMTGTPIAEIDYNGATGGALFEMMSMIGYDAWAIGNHDLDISQDNLRKLSRIAKFATLSANLVDTLGNRTLNNRDYVILKKDGLRIGVIGVMSQDLFHLTNTNNLKGLKVLPPSEIVQRIIDKIDPETDLIVAVTHEGVEDDSILAVNTHGLDVIIGGHSHTRLRTPKVIKGVIICQAGANCENVGELNLVVDHDSVTSFDGKLHTLWLRTSRPEKDISRFITKFQERIQQEYGDTLGKILSDWKRSSSGESNIGHFIADGIREGAGSHMGVTNSSGIRKELSAGSVTKLDLFEISPFRNYLCTFTLSGKEVREFSQRYVEQLAKGRSSIQISGLQCTWGRGNGSSEIQHLSIGGEEVVDDKTYVCATSDFVINQGDRYLGMIPDSVTYTQKTIFEALVEKVRKEETISAELKFRFREIK
ncbi:MAG TPA: bifunctional UDP-sugar hydrolase/5'-nucleotidase [Bacteroidota bacterium]|nr:bifunctional UDP-sugar hydrolase/5'-nucleotidase [Bacteroidota bacterium]